jgi:multisubunit Na+/H+ antiporter MnhB subunit
MAELLAVLILFMIVGALVAVETTNLLYSIVSIGAVGFLLAMVFLFLGAPDLAITQIVVEVITLVVLLRAVIHRQAAGPAGHRAFFAVVASAVVVVVLTAAAVIILTQFPRLGTSVMDRVAEAPSNVYLSEGLPRTGAANIVTSVLLDFRAYDTLGEATVLFCSVLGALTILRRRARKKPEDPDKESEHA